jgi:hypothetical protein
MSNHFSAMAKRVCGHEGKFSFSSYNDMKDRLYASHTVCGHCRIDIEKLVAPVDKGFYKMSLPSLVGIGKTASYANALRIKVLRSVGPVMAKLKASDEPYAEAALAVYELLFKIESAAYWIECDKRRIVGVQEHIFTATWVINEVEALMLGRPSSVIRRSPDSALLFMQRNNPAAVALAQVAAQKMVESLSITILAHTDALQANAIEA